MKTNLSILASLLILASCQQSSIDGETGTTNVETEVRQILNNYYKDIAASGLTAEFNYLDSSKQFFWVPPGFKGPISYDSVARILKQNAPKYRSIKNTFDTLSVMALTNETATYTGRLHSTMTDTAGKTIEFKMVETGVLIKRKNGWKLLCGQTSVLNP